MCSTAILVLSAVAVVLGAGYEVARSNTSELVREKAELITGSLAGRLRGHLDPARILLEDLAHTLADERLDLADREVIGRLLKGSLAAVPQVSVVAFADPELQVLRAFRNRPGRPVTLSDWSDDPDFRRAMALDRAATGARWGDLFFAEEAGRTLITVSLPLRRSQGFAGSLIAAVAIERLSEFLLTIADDYSYNAFVLYDRQFVLAHPMLAGGFPGLSDERPLPSLIQFGDPVLSEIWSQKRDRELEASLTGRVATRAVEFAGTTYVFLFRSLEGYSEKPWLVGTYLHLDDAAAQIARLEFVPRIGLGIALLALVVAVLLSRMLSRPVRRLARAAMEVRSLDPANVPALPRGLFRELNETARAFDAMTGALQSFMTYVPRSLVLKLVEQGAGRSLASQECEITILFTDIVGFTALAENRPAAQVADFLNHHFSIIGGCVEAEGGTIDKYMGDALMAFWGAPQRQGDHAERACRAAVAIAHRVELENARRRKTGEPPIRLRVGIHSGTAIVGNIGAPGRINYTVIGDSVNVAERLEALARTLADPAADVAILVSDATAEQLGSEFRLDSLGRHQLRGRHEETEVYHLERARTADA